MAEKTLSLTPLKNFLNSEHRKLMTPECPAFEASAEYARQLKAVGIAKDAPDKSKSVPLPVAEEPPPVIVQEPSRASPVEFDDLTRVVVTGTPISLVEQGAPAPPAPPAPPEPTAAERVAAGPTDPATTAAPPIEAGEKTAAPPAAKPVAAPRNKAAPAPKSKPAPKSVDREPRKPRNKTAAAPAETPPPEPPPASETAPPATPPAATE